MEASDAVTNKGGRGMIDKAINALTKARDFITSFKTDHAVIINLSDVEINWFCYNDIALIKWYTQFQSFMGAYSTVECHSLGFGAMHLFKDNRGPPYLVQRGKVYTFDGKNLSLVYAKA